MKARNRLALTLTIIAAAALATGCTALQQIIATAPVIEIPAAPTNAVQSVRAAAIVLGLTRVDPAAYDGWDGACPGCDVDAAVFSTLCREQGLETTVLLNAQATRQALVTAAANAWAGMLPGSLLALYVSGHGGQVADTSGDEADGQDETLCLWDGELSDDVLRTLWDQVPAGVRVFYVTDTCNSGSNYRARNYRRAIPRNYTGELIHIGGCADGLSSFGDAQGGTLTTAMIDAWSNGITYRPWFDATAALMPANQVPVYAEYGQVTDAFRASPVFTAEPAPRAPWWTGFLRYDASVRIMNMLSIHWPWDLFIEQLDWLQANNANCCFLFLANWGDGPGGAGNLANRTSFYRGDNFAGYVDPAKVAEMHRRVAEIRRRGMVPIYWLLPDDSGSWIPYREVNVLKRYFSDAVREFGDTQPAYWVIALEANEYMSRARSTVVSLAAHLDTLTDVPIGLHLTSGQTAWAVEIPQVDVLFYQSGWLTSESQVSDHMRRVQAVCPKPIFFSEYDRDSNRGLGRRAIAEGAIGAGNF